MITLFLEYALLCAAARRRIIRVTECARACSAASQRSSATAGAGTHPRPTPTATASRATPPLIRDLNCPMSQAPKRQAEPWALLPLPEAMADHPRSGRSSKGLGECRAVQVQWALLVKYVLLHQAVAERWGQLGHGLLMPPSQRPARAPPKTSAGTSSTASGASSSRAAGPGPGPDERGSASASGTNAVPDLRNMTTAQRLSALQQMDLEKLRGLAARLGVPGGKTEKDLLLKLAPLVLNLPKEFTGQAPPMAPGVGTQRRGKKAATFDQESCMHILKRMASQPREQAEAELAGYRVEQELQPLARAAGLPVSGRKRDLIDRLMGYRVHLADQGSTARCRRSS